jgi:hypothetical protein
VPILPPLAAFARRNPHLGRDGRDPRRQAFRQRFAHGLDLLLLAAQEGPCLRAQKALVQCLELFARLVLDLLADQLARTAFNPGGLQQRYQQQPAEDGAAQQRKQECERSNQVRGLRFYVPFSSSQAVRRRI